MRIRDVLRKDEEGETAVGGGFIKAKIFSISTRQDRLSRKRLLRGRGKEIAQLESSLFVVQEKTQQ